MVRRFLGSVWFAMLLIGTTAVFVAIGTIVEAKTDSHLTAATWIYSSWPFTALLFGFFLNILISALNRWPFKQGHIPFLITHLGLLLVIGGTICKNIFGLQGTMVLYEGSGSSHVTLPNTTQIALETTTGKRYTYPLNHSWGRWTADNPTAPFHFTVLDHTPNCTLTFDSFLKGSHATLHGFHPFSTGTPVTLPLQPHQDWTIFANDATPPEDLPLPHLIITADTLKATDPHGRTTTHSYSREAPERLFVYDEGFGGYTTAVDLPLNPLSPQEMKQEHLAFLKTHLENNRQELNPPLKWFSTLHSETFADDFLNFLDTWNEQGTWLASYPLNPSLLESETRHALQWCVQILDELEPDTATADELYALLQEQKWPLLDSLSNVDKHDLLDQVTRQIFSVADKLPPPADPPSNKLFSAYLRVFDIHLATLPKPTFPTTSLTLEAPLSPHITAATPIKPEHNRPAFLLHWKKGPQEGTLHLTPTSLKWPLPGARVRLEPQTRPLPHHVRLRRAYQINYPNSTNPAAYEAHLLIDGTPTLLKMNHVHETTDGTRFYLANIAPEDNSSIHRINLIINHDPFKYWVTYPGAFLAFIGIILLLRKK